MSETAETQTIYDVLIAGGGLAGLLYALRLSTQNPALKILLAEKEDTLGGRLALPSYGLGAMSEDLFRYIENIVRDHDLDLHSAVVDLPQRVGILVGGKMSQFSLQDFAKEASVKAYSGQAGLKDWPLAKDVLESRSEQSFAEKTSLGRKSGAALALQSFAMMSGIPDIWSSNVSALDERVGATRDRHVVGAWSKIISELEQIFAQRNVTVWKNARVVSATHKENLWRIRAGEHDVIAQKLAVAQPPWNAEIWLPKPEWPVQLLQLASKTKPVSAVTLSFEILDGVDKTLPQVIMIPAEDVQVRWHPPSEIVFQQTLDYEFSFQAPSVVKAIKALKRAARKFEQAFPQVKLTGDHVALVPICWPHSTGKIEAKTIAKLDMKELQKEHLIFIGDAYGSSYDEEKNLIHSLQSATLT